jgi:hypothetical protein
MEATQQKGKIYVSVTSAQVKKIDKKGEKKTCIKQ